MRLTDRTAPYSAYDAPLNVQTFVADVDAPARREIRDVALDLRGALEPMSNVSGDRWQVELALPACEEVIGYRFVVHSDDRGDTTPPFRRNEFPETGHFIRHIAEQPAECAERPMLGDRRFVVDTTDDLVDAHLGDGICSTSPDPASGESRCSLRAAVMEANERPGLNVITLFGGRYELTRTGAEGTDRPDAAVGDLDITDSLVIESFNTQFGCRMSLDRVLDPLSRPEPYRDRTDAITSSGVVKIDANGIDRVLDIYPGTGERPTEVYLNCLHLLGGNRAGDPDGEGGRVRGGGILNRATLLLNRVAVTQNTMTGVTSGAGIHNEGRLILRESALLHNEGDTGGAVFGGTSGGAIYNDGGGSVSIDRSVLAYNIAARGPAIMNNRRTDGEGIVRSAGVVSLTNTTVTQHEGGDSAGVLASAILNRGTARIYWSTLRETRKALQTSLGRAFLGNSILAAYSESPCASSGRGNFSLGGNWLSHDDCLASPLRSDVVDRRLFSHVRDTLSDYGGFTPSLALREPWPDEDPADFPIDHMESGLPVCPEVDQRGLLRPADGDGNGEASCDPGAFELGAAAPSS